MDPLKHAVSTVLPEPVFEGSEKRVEVDFVAGSAAHPSLGLRALPRELLDELMGLAHCTIVSSRSNDAFDSYVLSESSLFVYPTKWVLKTCGTTRLLDSVPRLLDVAAEAGMTPCRCKYTRASFLFPENQPSPHTGFDEEVAVLNASFGWLQPEGAGQAYVLGDEADGLQWHVYVAGRTQATEPTFNLEMCMTELDETAAAAFFRNESFVSSHATTVGTGIVNLLPDAAIDDYVFEPCGYSMNGMRNHQFITIHVTPEKGFSYASVEISGHGADLVDCSNLLAAAANIFKPGRISIAMSVDDATARGAASWGTLSFLPPTYSYLGAHGCKLMCGGRVVYYTLAGGPDHPHRAKSTSPCSPRTVLHHSASVLSALGGQSGGTASCGIYGSDDTGSDPACSSEGEGDCSDVRSSGRATPAPLAMLLV